MKTILFSILISFLIIYSGGSCKTVPGELPEPFLIIPQPQKVELLKGSGIKSGTLKQIRLTGTNERPVMGCILAQLTESDNTGKKGILTLHLDDKLDINSHEGYILRISGGNVVIQAKDEAGLFYGCQTLEQLLEDARDFDIPVPSCEITDSPELAYRAVHFDVKHHLDHMNYYYESIDRLARYKINAIIFEFEDKLRYRKQPLVGAPQAISIDEMAALTNYARKRHIEISPLVQGLGHATFILKHDEYADLRELRHNRWAFCPLDEGTYKVLFDLYSDAVEATPGSKYLHVGGDEIGNIGICPRCKPTADKEGKLVLHLHWLKKVCAYAEEIGRIPIVWDDMPLRESGLIITSQRDFKKDEADSIWNSRGKILEELIEDFPDNCVYMRWNYTTRGNSGDAMALEWYKKHGLKSMAATAAQSGAAALFPFENREVHPYRGTLAIKDFVELAAEKEIEGMLCTAWDDRSPHFETYWHGFITSAEYSWSPGKRLLEDFDQAYLQREHGITFHNYIALYYELRRAAIFWEKSFLLKGSRLDLNNILSDMNHLAHWLPPQETTNAGKKDYTNLLIKLPDPQNPGTWSAKYDQRLNEADSIINEYKNTDSILDDLYKRSKRNRYHWKVFSAVNDFQVTAPKLLIALGKCDTNDATLLSKGIEQVKLALEEYKDAWENLQMVYNETRFFAYPSDYVPDRYFHFASQREDLTWKVQVEELFHEMVIQWLSEL